jgi:hypothetical protein
MNNSNNNLFDGPSGPGQTINMIRNLTGADLDGAAARQAQLAAQQPELNIISMILGGDPYAR